MSSYAFVLLLALSATTVLARSTFDYREPHHTVSLNKAVNKTVCPFYVEEDRDELRIPKVIKTIKCGDHLRHSCHTHHDGLLARCEELHDDVLVYYPAGYGGDRELTKIRQTVPVGCVCMLYGHSDGMQRPEPGERR